MQFSAIAVQIWGIIVKSSTISSTSITQIHTLIAQNVALTNSSALPETLFVIYFSIKLYTMKQKKTLSVIFAALVLFSSFIPVSSSHSPTGCDLYVQNNTDVVLASTNFVSSLDDVTFFNIAPHDANSGMLHFDSQDAVTISMTLSSPLPKDAVARIYNGGHNNQVGSIDFPAGVTGGATRIYAPIASDAIWIYVDYN